MTDLRGEMKEMGEKFEGRIEETRDEVREMGETSEGTTRGQMGDIKELIEGSIWELREEMRRRDEEWRAEKEELREKIEELEERVREIGGRDRREGRGEEEREWKEKLKELERRVEMADRAERRRNIIIRGIRTDRGKEKEAVKEVLKRIGVEVEVESARQVGQIGESGKGMVVPRLQNEIMKKEVFRKKRDLGRGGERIEENLTQKERRIQRKLREIVEQERRAGGRAIVGYGKICIGNTWWRWSEEEERLREWGGHGREGREVEGVKGKGNGERREEGEGRG
ncbi:golgin subfamily A member 6-like protein 1 [Hylaeus volcanicus]|uniref:golgin subfamily A member 6-like protein 1 n=1 Tax=Hylaeus volcanicus TaxID=313075 RepID=UPI0023B85D98|nr:golgin subfamily A member 6-like protein 1 [Hylaeus volcanicus]